MPTGNGRMHRPGPAPYDNPTRPGRPAPRRTVVHIVTAPPSPPPRPVP
ncbi:hypothetical protein QFZ63_003206 [Streptomyces sp. B3I7]|nr:hypothetical protein [Streptomyces sp. B3I7]